MVKLDAVNLVLEGIGQPAVSALEPGQATTAGEAERYLDQADRRVQGMFRWSFNTDWDRTLTRDGSVQYPVASTVLMLSPRRDFHPDLRVGIRAALLWDIQENRDTFPDHPTLRVFIQDQLIFTELTDSMQELISAEAALKYARYKKRGRVEEAMLRDQRTDAMVLAKKRNIVIGPTNVLGTLRNREMLGGRLPLDHLRV